MITPLVEEQWPEIKKLLKITLTKSMQCGISTVDPDGNPHISPIGSLFLTEFSKGFFFEMFASNMRANLERNNRFCIALVNSGRWFFFRSLFMGKFNSHPGIRLYGEIGKRRKAKSREVMAFRKAVKSFKWLKGYDLLWKTEGYVRDITIEGVKTLNLGKMNVSHENI